MTIRMAYEMVMPYHLHMPSYFLETFTEYPFLICIKLGFISGRSSFAPRLNQIWRQARSG
ncbi:hypothetical protein FSA02_22300 [Phocaeicola dorei]|nr:hypothetical protein FSA02_22300 [Phocaeicola dorei]